MSSDVGVLGHIVKVFRSERQSGGVVELVEDQLDDFIYANLRLRVRKGMIRKHTTQVLHGVWWKGS